MDTTKMVRSAGLAAFGTEAIADEVESIWRATSGAAHGLAWVLLGRSDTAQVAAPDADGIAPFVAGGGIDRIANEYMCAYKIAEHGWQLLSERGADIDNARS